MRNLARCAGVLLAFTAVAASAAQISRATLVGQHRVPGTTGQSSLICEYSGVRARFQLLSQHGRCASFIEVQ